MNGRPEAVAHNPYRIYWKRPQEIDGQIFAAIVSDFKRTLPGLKKRKVKLAGGDGHGEPRIDPHGVCFNGAVRCGHRHGPPDVWGTLADYFSQPQESVTSPFLEVARGRLQRVRGHRPSSASAGQERQRRHCPGSCAFEEFVFPRVNWHPHHSLDEVWSTCATDRRHYELAVQVWLIVAKFHMGDELCLKGLDSDWEDARGLCQKVLGYGRNLGLFAPPSAREGRCFGTMPETCRTNRNRLESLNRGIQEASKGDAHIWS